MHVHAWITCTIYRYEHWIHAVHMWWHAWCTIRHICLDCFMVQVTSWSDLPIDPQVKEALSKVEHQQQLAIWEFIYTEHSHIRHLETIINVSLYAEGKETHSVMQLCLLYTTVQHIFLLRRGSPHLLIDLKFIPLRWTHLIATIILHSLHKVFPFIVGVHEMPGID